MRISSLFPCATGTQAVRPTHLLASFAAPEEPLHLSHSGDAGTPSHDLQTGGARMDGRNHMGKQELQSGAIC